MFCNIFKRYKGTIKLYLKKYNFILGGDSDSLLFKNVREKNSLCYSISSSFKPLNKFLIISSGINPDSFKKAYRLIRISIHSPYHYF